MLTNFETFPVQDDVAQMHGYRDRGIRPDTFYYYLLCNDAFEARRHGTRKQLAYMGPILVWMAEELPVISRGGKDLVDAWRGVGGLFRPRRQASAMAARGA